MTITFTDLIIWIIIAAIVGVIGELIAGRRAPDGILGAIIVGFLAIFLIVGVLHFHIGDEPLLNGVPLISSVIVAAILVFLWSRFAYRRYHGYASRYYYRRGTYARHPRRRFRLF
ncbi:MAG TPA: transglycosylase [Ktedonobacteraceae bacterium]|nr:transglycosylase [Ktedonobacteraceae bacterium]